MKNTFYELKKIPDLSLAKYQSLSEQGVEGVLTKQGAFLRQWQKISASFQIYLNLYISFCPERPEGEKISVFLGFFYNNESLEESIHSLINASSLTDFYSFTLCPQIPDVLIGKRYLHKNIIKKCERQRECLNENKELIPLFFVETWEGNEEGRLYDMLKALSAINRSVIYCVSLCGEDSYDEIYKSLEKPITYLRNKIANRNEKEIKLIKEEGFREKRDIVAEETLKIYEDFLKGVSKSPCYHANIFLLSDDDTVAKLLLNTACGEAVEKGNWDIMSLREGQYTILDDFHYYSRLMPKTLNYWPTIFLLEEIIPFFRLPIVFEGELINLKKETEPDGNNGEIFLGNDFQKRSISFPVELLKKHAFVCGVPGAGKTNTMLHLCNTLWNKCRIPFLILEPAKKEYRALARVNMEELIVFSPSSGSQFPLAINPFEFPKGMSLAEHIQNLMDVFEGAFPLTPPLPALLDRSIESIYEKYEWDTEDINDGQKVYPTMSELYEQLAYQLENTSYDGEVRGNMKSALEMRIGSLLRRDLGNVFDVRYSSLLPEELLRYPIIIEMESMGRGPSNFVTLMICTLIREVLRINPDADKDKPVRHVIFIEEAHNLIAFSTEDTTADNANPKIAATNYIVQMLAEVRALREGIIIADQLPTTMAPEVVKNTNLKIAHRLTSGDDRSLIGSTMSATDSQAEELATYMPGNALISYEGLLKPFKMQIQSVEWKDAPDTQMLLKLMKKRSLHKQISLNTTRIRLDKYKEKWISEWDQMMVVFNKLEKDCAELRAATLKDDIKELVSIIVKDQMGIDNCLYQMKKIIRTYKRVLDLSIDTLDDEGFLEDMESGIERIVQATINRISTVSAQ